MRLCARKKGGGDGRGQTEGKETKKEERTEKRTRPKAGGVQRRGGRGAAVEASAGLNIEVANEVQHFQSLAERTKRLAGKETKEGPTKLHYSLPKILTS